MNDAWVLPSASGPHKAALSESVKILVTLTSPAMGSQTKNKTTGGYDEHAHPLLPVVF